MKKIILSIASLLIGSMVHAQTGALAGKWEFEAAGRIGTDRLVIDFKVEGNKLGGTITRNDPPGQPPAALAGEINGDMIVFTVQSPDGLRTITMTGKISGDEIIFARVVSGAEGAGHGLGFYGLKGPATVVAKRVKL